MAKYRKKPVVIDAVQWTGFNLQEMREFLPHHLSGEDNSLNIKTLEGVMRADKGDWIIKGVKGEFYPCKPDIFEQTYEPVSPE